MVCSGIEFEMELRVGVQVHTLVAWVVEVVGEVCIWVAVVEVVSCIWVWACIVVVEACIGA